MIYFQRKCLYVSRKRYIFVSKLRNMSINKQENQDYV